MFDAKIQNFMIKDPLIVSVTDDLARIGNRMAETGKDVAIVMDKDQIKGLVSVQDIVNATKKHVLKKLSFEKIPKNIRTIHVQELLQNRHANEFMEACELEGYNVAVALGENDSLVDAFKVMSNSGADHIVVICPDGSLGTLSAHDIIQVYKEFAYS